MIHRVHWGGVSQWTHDGHSSAARWEYSQGAAGMQREHSRQTWSGQLVAELLMFVGLLSSNIRTKMQIGHSLADHAEMHCWLTLLDLWTWKLNPVLSTICYPRSPARYPPCSVLSLRSDGSTGTLISEAFYVKIDKQLRELLVRVYDHANERCAKVVGARSKVSRIIYYCITSVISYRLHYYLTLTKPLTY